MLKNFLKTITRQQLLVSTIPWLAQFWGESDKNGEERLLAAEYPKRHLDRYRKPHWVGQLPPLPRRLRQDHLKDLSYLQNKRRQSAPEAC